MKLSIAKERINELSFKPFSDYLNEDEIKDAMLIINKGRTGQLLELTIGLGLSSNTLDFDDGELKTNKCDRNGNPKETMFITQTSSIIDELLSKKRFEDSKLYKKINHLLYVPISKEGPPPDWMYLKSIEVDLSLPKYTDLFYQLKLDYYEICDKMNEQLQKSDHAMLHTVSGEFIQIRTKDSKPYNPIYSHIYGRKISDKNRAFYFKKEFMKYIVALDND